MTRVLYVIKTINEKYVIGTTYCFPLTMMYIFKYHKLIHYDKPFYIHKQCNMNVENDNTMANSIICDTMREYIEKYGEGNVIRLKTYDRE